jgi:hypothetical protein
MGALAFGWVAAWGDSFEGAFGFVAGALRRR